jgi:hypothetical protein
VRGALADTVVDNQRLAIKFRLLLQEMERIQMSQDEKDIELSRTKKELDLLKHTHQLMTSRLKKQGRCTTNETSEAIMMPVAAKRKLKPAAASKITSRNAYVLSGGNLQQ